LPIVWLSGSFTLCPRAAKIVIIETPYHIVQRGHIRQAVFVSDEDYYRRTLIYYLSPFTVNYQPRIYFMKPLLFCLRCSVVVLLCLISPDLMAAEWHIKPSSEVPLRRGQGIDYKIDAVISDGTKVTLLEVDGDWAQIQLEGGREGWILKRYLSDEIPLRHQIAELEQNKADLEVQLIQVDNHLAELMEVNTKTEQTLTVCTDERDTVNADYQRLQKDTANVVQTKEKLATAERNVSELSSRFGALEIENKGLKNNTSLIWFLTGSGVLLLGLLIGVVAGKRSKKRYGSLL
jgi:SH3 domain protein